MTNPLPPAIQVDIETLPLMHIASYRSISAAPEDDGWPIVSTWMEAHHLPEPRRHFGFDIEVSPEDQKAGFRGYEFWIVLPEGWTETNGMNLKEFPGGLYAVTVVAEPFVDPFDRIPSGWKNLHEWVILSEQYRGGCHQWLEEVIVHDSKTDMKMYHPVKKI